MNACVETVSPVEDVVSLAHATDYADEPRIEAGFDEALASTEDLVSTEMRPEVSLAINQAAVTKRRWWLMRWLRGGNTTRAAKSPHVVHVRVDALFASVEQVLNPKLKGKALLVGRGVVTSASPEAVLQGVKTGMSISEALRICPDATVAPGHYKQYADFAERVRRILETFTPAVETSALNDFYLDFAGSEELYPDFAAMLRRLQAEILAQTGLSVSLGAARTKVVASMASQVDYPRGLRIVLPHEEGPFIAALPVKRLPNLGDLQVTMLKESGVTTIGQLRLVPKPVLKSAFGEAIGEEIWLNARGRDGRWVSLPATAKSLSREIAIEGGTVDAEFLDGLLGYLSERIGNSLQEGGKQADALGVRIRYVDHYSAQQSVRLTRATGDQCELRRATKKLFADLFTRRVAIRHITVNATSLNRANSLSRKTVSPNTSAVARSEAA